MLTTNPHIPDLQWLKQVSLHYLPGSGRRQYLIIQGWIDTPDGPSYARLHFFVEMLNKLDLVDSDEL